jgi:hypothetical protein
MNILIDNFSSIPYIFIARHLFEAHLPIFQLPFSLSPKGSKWSQNQLNTPYILRRTNAMIIIIII